MNSEARLLDPTGRRLQTALGAYILVLMGTKQHVQECNADRLTNDERATAMARKYVWWQPPEHALADRPLFLAQMMNLGTADDLRWLLSRVSASELRDPPIGIFDARSWNFWHVRLGLTPPASLPARSLPREFPR